MKLSFKAIEREMLKNGLDCDEATLKSVSSGVPVAETNTANLTKAAPLTISDVQSETSDTTTTTTTTSTTTTTTTTTVNSLPPVTVTGTIPNSSGGGSIDLSVTVTPSQWNAATTTGSYQVDDLPFAAGAVTVTAQLNPSSGTYNFSYSQMIPPDYSDFMSQLDDYYLLHVPPPPIFIFIGCYQGYSGTNVTLYQVGGTDNFAAYNLSLAIDNDGDPTAASVDPYVAQDPVTGYYLTSLKTGLSGQDNNLDASKINYLAVSSEQRISTGIKMGDYVAVTNNDPNSPNFGQTFYGVVGDSSGANKHLGEMSYHFALEVFGTNSGITKTSADILNKVNIMIAKGSANTTDDGENIPTYTLNLNNDGVIPATQEEIQDAINNNGSAIFSFGAQGSSSFASLFQNPPSGVSPTCTP